MAATNKGDGRSQARLALRANGRSRALPGDPERPLLGVLRDELHLTGSKYGCGEAQCGACTVLLDDKAARSCITPAAGALGKSITTIEGLARGARLHPLQQAFIDADALQCGYCTPGMIMSALALLRRNADPSPAEIKAGLQGNICRCGTYPRIIAAVAAAAATMRARGETP